MFSSLKDWAQLLSVLPNPYALLAERSSESKKRDRFNRMQEKREVRRYGGGWRMVTLCVCVCVRLCVYDCFVYGVCPIVHVFDYFMYSPLSSYCLMPPPPSPSLLCEPTCRPEVTERANFVRFINERPRPTIENYINTPIPCRFLPLTALRVCVCGVGVWERKGRLSE